MDDSKLHLFDAVDATPRFYVVGKIGSTASRPLSSWPARGRSST
jgi:hypothetical protein